MKASLPAVACTPSTFFRKEDNGRIPPTMRCGNNNPFDALDAGHRRYSLYKEIAQLLKDPDPRCRVPGQVYFD